jgi:hypothetical protein
LTARRELGYPKVMRLCLVALLLVVAPVRAEEVVEPSTEQKFPAQRQVDGQTYTLVGVGVRKKVVVKVYAIAIYVEDEPARRDFPALTARAGGREHARLVAGDAAPQFVTWGHFGKLAVLRFVRDVDADRVREAFREGLEEELGDKATPEGKRTAEAFVAAFDHELKEGQEIELRTWPDGRVAVTVAGARRDLPQSPKLARAIWSIWLGARPISTELRRSLIDRVDALGK